MPGRRGRTTRPGRLSVRRLSVGRLTVGRLTVGRLTVGRLAVGSLVVVAGTGLVGCGGAGRAAPATTGTTTPGGAPAGATAHLAHATLRVPSGSYPTLQDAVDRAAPGDLVLVAAGTYRGGVTVSTPDVVVRGVDRNTVIFDGGNEVPNGFTVTGDGDAVENLTVRHYAINGVLFTKAAYGGAGSQAGPSTPYLVGYRASYITSYDNGLYGIYAFVARDGEVDHVYASGQPDSGIYIGQCRACDAVVTDSVATGNRVGFEAANASGGLDVVDSDFSFDRDGIAIESSLQEQLAPQSAALVAGNLVESNDNRRTPTEDEDTDVFGYGIAIGGGSHDTVVDNRVTGNASVGIVLSDLAGYRPADDTVRANVLGADGTDLAYVPVVGSADSGAGNCFVANRYSSSVPADIEARLPCGAGGRTVPGGSFRTVQGPAGVNYETLPTPPAQPGMPAASTAPADPATDLPPPVDLARIAVPRP